MASLTDGVTTAEVSEGDEAGTLVIGPRTWSDVDVSEAHSEVYFGDGTFSGKSKVASQDVL